MKGAIKKVSLKKECGGKNGPFYIFEITVAGDEKIYQHISQTNPQTAFTEGAEVEYTTETKVAGEYTNHYIRPVTQKKNFQANPQRLELDKKIAAMNGAITLVCNGKVEIVNLEGTFKKLLTYLS